MIREAAPYLSRLYAVLKQSSVNLNCLRGKAGDSYCSYIDKVRVAFIMKISFKAQEVNLLNVGYKFCGFHGHPFTKHPSDQQSNITHI